MSDAMREAAGVICGFLLFIAGSTLLFAVSGYDPYREVTMAFRVFSIVAGILLAFAAGYVTALISRVQPVRAAMIVSLLIAVISIASMFRSFSGEWWSQLAALFLMSPTVVLGARYRRNQRMRRMSSRVDAEV